MGTIPSMDPVAVERALHALSGHADRADEDDDGSRRELAELRQHVADGQLGAAWVVYGRLALVCDTVRGGADRGGALAALRAALGVSDAQVAAALSAHHARRDKIGYEVDRGRVIARTVIPHDYTPAVTVVVRAWLSAVAASGSSDDGPVAGLAALDALVHEGKLCGYTAADLVDDHLGKLFANLASQDTTPTYFFDTTGAHRYDPLRRAVWDRWGVLTVRCADIGSLRRRLVNVINGPACLTEFSSLFRAGRADASITTEMLTCAAQLWDPTGRGQLINADTCLEVAAMISPDDGGGVTAEPFGASTVAA